MFYDGTGCTAVEGMLRTSKLEPLEAMRDNI